MSRTGSVALVLLVAAAFWLQWPPQVSAARPNGGGGSGGSGGPKCEVGQQQPGCRIYEGRCVCGIGCRSEYQYAGKEECTAAIRGQRRNQCSEIPCHHGGACSQSTMDPGFKCRCEGTGFYGPRCQYACPIPGSVGYGRPFPHECILI